HLLQAKLSFVEDDRAFAFVAVVDRLHLRDVVEPADDVRRSERVAGLHLLAVQLLNEADVAALMAPRFRHLGRIERHPRQPRTGFAIAFHLIGPDHSLGNLAVLPLIQILRIGTEIVLERRCGQWFAKVAQIDLLEVIAVLVADMTWHVNAIKKIVYVIDTGDSLARQEPADPWLKDEDLLPGRAGLVTLAGLVEGVALADSDEVRALDHLRFQFLRLRADLRTFDVMLGQAAVQLRFARIAIVAPTGSHQEIHN